MDSYEFMQDEQCSTGKFEILLKLLYYNFCVISVAEETTESHTEVGVNGLTTTTTSSAVTETSQEDKDGSVVVRKVVITRNRVVSTRQGVPQDAEPLPENEKTDVVPDEVVVASAPVEPTEESPPAAVEQIPTEEPTDGATELAPEVTEPAPEVAEPAPEVVSHTTVEVTSAESHEGDDKNFVHVQEENVKTSEIVESKTEDGSRIVESKEEVKESVSVRKIVTKETVPIVWPELPEGETEEPVVVEQSEQQEVVPPTISEVDEKVEPASVPTEEAVPATSTEPAADAAPVEEKDKDKPESEDKSKTDEQPGGEHLDDAKSDLTSEEGTLEHSKSKEGSPKLSPSKRFLAFFKRKSHKSKKKGKKGEEGASDKEEAVEKPEEDKTPKETTPAEPAEVQEEPISAVESKRDSTVPAFPSEPVEVTPSAPVESPPPDSAPVESPPPDSAPVEEPTPSSSSTPMKEPTTPSNSPQSESPAPCERQEIILTADNPKTFTMAEEKEKKAKSPKSPKSPGFFARTSQLLAPLHSHNDSFDSAITRSSRSSMDSGTSSDPNRHSGHFVVVAIDFGTTFSGYAFSFTRDPESIHMMRKWEGGDPGVINQKTPTCLLLTPTGEFRAFGFTARDLYHDLDPVEAEQWLYFEKFKMVLHYNAVGGMFISSTPLQGVNVLVIEQYYLSDIIFVFNIPVKQYKNEWYQLISSLASLL